MVSFNRFPTKHPDATLPLTKLSHLARLHLQLHPHQGLYQYLKLHIYGRAAACLHKQEKLTLSLLGFTYNFATDCTVLV